MTVDQRLTKNISFYGEGFYGIRRITFLNNTTTNQLTGIGVPTFNPYYPTGGAPTNLRVNYNMSIESPSLTGAYGSGMRYQGGLNIDLPGGWESPTLLFGDSGRRVQSCRRHNKQERRVRGLGLDVSRNPRQRHEPRGRHLDQACDHSLSEPVLRPDAVPVQLPDHLELCREL